MTVIEKGSATTTGATRCDCCQMIILSHWGCRTRRHNYGQDGWFDFFRYCGRNDAATLTALTDALNTARSGVTNAAQRIAVAQGNAGQFIFTMDSVP